MKKYHSKVLSLLFFLCIWYGAICQIGWTQKANFPGTARYSDVSFTIGHYAFVGCGVSCANTYLTDFWKYNSHTNTWTAIPSYPGSGPLSGIGFAIEGKGYVGLGWTSSNGANDLWRYDTITNAWTQMATFPGSGRYATSAFVIGHKAYVVGGSVGGAPYLQDLWVYDAHQNTWTQKANWPGGDVEAFINFSIGNRGYVGDGWYPGCQEQMFEYDTTANTWTPIAPPPQAIGITETPDTWVIGAKGYVCTGGNCSDAGQRDGWMYDTVTKSWCEFAYIAAAKLSRGNAVAFTLDNMGYFCTGQDTNRNCLADLWEYTPSTEINVSDTAGGCSGASVQFSSTTSYLGSAWSWSFPGGVPTTSTLQNPAVSYPVSGTYTAKLILTACGGGDTVSRTITVIAGALGGVTLNGKSPICKGTSDTLTIAGGTSYTWSTGATTSSIIISSTSTTTYSVTVVNGVCSKDTSIKITVLPYPTISLTGNDTVCAGISTTLTASGGTSYLWNTGATTNFISPLPTSNTTYSVTVSNGACSRDTSINVIVNPSPALIAGPPSNTICSSQTVALSASGAISYTWTPATGLSCTTCSDPMANPTSSTTYVVTGYNTDGCTSSKNISVIVETGETLTAIPNQSICTGNQTTLIANGVSGGGGSYIWQPGGSTDETITVSPATTTIYTVQYTNACGTSDTTVTVFVNPAPTPSFSADIVQGCAPLCIEFKDLSTISSTGTITMWSWAFGNGDSTHAQNPLYCYPDTGTFTPSITAVSSNGCSATLKIDQMITVFSKPVANFIYSPQSINILNPTVQFTDESTDAYGIAYRFWTFGDATDSISNLKKPSHTYQDTGFFCPQLIVENIKGCVDTTRQCLEVDPIFTLYIPSAFSPNGDGIDDTYEPKGVYVKSFEMYIFDRWGMELYHTTDIYQGWNGTVHGGSTISQEDSYVYKITATDWWDVQHSYIGEFTLVK
jgi:gliding motility-associated-like protein